MFVSEETREAFPSDICAIFELASTAPLGDPRGSFGLILWKFLFVVAGVYIFVELQGKLILLQDAFGVVRFAWCGD